jgi:hypothetical protein
MIQWISYKISDLSRMAGARQNRRRQCEASETPHSMHRGEADRTAPEQIHLYDRRDETPPRVELFGFRQPARAKYERGLNDHAALQPYPRDLERQPPAAERQKFSITF